MSKRLFIHGISSGIIASLISYVYTISFKKLVDFTEHTGYFKLLAFSLMITMGVSIIELLLSKLFTNKNSSSFIANCILISFTLLFVLKVFEMTDPEFKSEDANLMIDYYKGFLMPLVFLPSLIWLGIKPLFNIS
ncbi:MAG TPA: hypothetical protein PLI97_06570 [Fluviicola sp.]|nr:hypothetical protein [Fluviicola sp.]